MNTQGRRRKQAIGGYKNIRPAMRPHYANISAEKSARREAKKVEVARRITSGKK